MWEYSRGLRYIALAWLSFQLFGATAHDGELDELGCHEEPVSLVYHCHSGPLSGREFVSKDAAIDTLESLVNPDGKGDAALPQVKILSWNARSFGQEGFDYDRAAAVLNDADLVVLHEVQIVTGGTDPLNVLASVWSQRSKERICKAWAKVHGTKNRFGFLWKEPMLGHVNAKGEIKERCDDTAIRVEMERQMALVTFYSKIHKQMFSVAGVQLDARSKRPERDLRPIFQRLGALMWPAVLVGDLSLPSSHPVFKDKSIENFAAAFKRRRGPYDNVWLKGAEMLDGERVELKKRFADIAPSQIKRTISAEDPLRARVAFVDRSEEANAIQVQHLKAGKAARKAAAAKKPAAKGNGKAKKPVGAIKGAKVHGQVEVYAPVNAKKEKADLHEDLGSEVSEVEKSVSP